jgi:gentisate 1,2-dioxygenase
MHRRVHNGRTLIRSQDVPVVHSRQGVSQFYLMPQDDDLSLTQWSMFVRDLSEPGGRHRHQGGIALFVLAGDGHTTVNERRVDWSQHDVVYLPIVPGGLDHQHFSDTKAGSAQFMGIIYEPLIAGMGAEITQLDPNASSRPPAPLEPVWDDNPNAPAPLSWGSVTPTLSGLVAIRENQRRAIRVPPVIRERDLTPDDNEFGRLRWYAHPAKPEFAGTAPFLLFTQELEAGQTSRVLACPGNGFLFVLEGRPIVRINDKVHECAANDLVCLPPRTDGVRVSVTAGGEESSLVLIAMANLSGLAGVAMGSDFELM